MKHIIFVCHGNICRSPMAAFIMRALLQAACLEGQYTVTSAATSTEEIGNPIHPGTQNICEKYHLPWDKHHHAHQITITEASQAEYIIAMDQANVRNLKRMLPLHIHAKIRLLLSYTSEERDIADPWYTANFEATYCDITNGCKAFLQTLLTAKD